MNGTDIQNRIDHFGRTGNYEWTNCDGCGDPIHESEDYFWIEPEELEGLAEEAILCTACFDQLEATS